MERKAAVQGQGRKIFVDYTDGSTPPACVSSKNVACHRTKIKTRHTPICVCLEMLKIFRIGVIDAVPCPCVSSHFNSK